MSEAKPALGTIVSPCIRICCLDDKDVCLGCFRTLDEIRNWQASDDTRRALVLEHCAERREAHDREFPGLASQRR
jgi:predicted Fe-S protein YdhL (DUF1289 family)